MAKVKIQGHASGTGVLTVTAPNTSTDRTITLPDSTGTLATTADNGSQLDHSGTKKIEAVSTGAQIQNRLEVITPNDSSTHLVQRLGSTDGSYGYVDLELVSPNSTAASLPRLDLQVGNSTVASFLRGGGITFNGDTAAANALDDYEEGTWTPAWNSGSNGRSIANSGSYTKIGNRVYVSGQFNINGSNNTGSGDVSFSGLPFTSNSEGNYRAAVSSMWASLATSANISGWVQDGSQLFYFRENGTTGDGNDLGNHIDQDTYFWFSATYMV